MRFFYAYIFIAIFTGSKGYCDTISDHLLAPVTCKDILFVAMPLALDKDGDRIRMQCYTLCMSIEILKDKLSRLKKEKDRRILIESINCIEKLSKVAIMAFRAHYFVFGPMKFREFICEKTAF
ncbi:hypothetical protein HE1_00120 [Holospora elegans E1]|uniref:Uncharacterized protein n=1 Tax=Holospora elegans E1 TaxID=1427503 RepID=A0A023DWS8_9PROT|nr:hypothetical protein [Holospora elegans]GAJ45811.1 hypothetical protein HE1_00120 [Holospora elegans E1]